MDVQSDETRTVAQLTAIIDSVPTAIIMVDASGRIELVNSHAEKLFGYSREKATRLMHQVHYEGKAAVSSGAREQAEADVARLHAHGLWATMEHPG